MTVLDALRGAARPHDTVEVPAPGEDTPAVVLPVMTRAQFGLLLAVGALLVAATVALVLGPARGMRNDIASVDANLATSEKGIYGTLGTGREALAVVRTQLAAAEQSLVLQRDGLEVAQAAEQDTTAIREQTDAALQTVREVTAALGPQGEQVGRLVEDVETAVRLAQAAVRVAEQTLATGREALAVARDTLATLQRSEQVQRELLETARATLQETREINRKIPGAPVFP